MAEQNTSAQALSDQELQDLVAQTDTGARAPGGVSEKIILWVAGIWSLFQLWIASPLPFMIGIGVFKRYRGAFDSFSLRNIFGFSGIPCAESLAA